MKQNIFILSFMAVAAMTSACQKNLDETAPGNLVKVSFSANPAGTRTDIDPAGAVKWNSSDHLSVFTDVDGSNCYDFSITSLNPEKTVAEFEGSVPSNGSRTAAYAIYPYKPDYSGGPDAVAVSIPATQADGTNYSIMAGKGVVAGDDFSGAHMAMKHLCWIYDVNISNPSSKAIKAVHFSAGSGVFTTAGTVDLTSATPSVSATSTAKTVTVEYATAKSTDVTARFTLFPLSCSDVDFNIHVEFEDGLYETFAAGSMTLNIAAGARKSNSLTLGSGVASNAPWGWYFVASGNIVNDGTIISNAKAVPGGNGKDVKLYLEPGGTFSTSARINPSATFMMDSDPANRPTINQGSAAIFTPKTDNSYIETISIKNINLVAGSSLGNSYVLWTSDETSASITIGSIEFDNCTMRDYKDALVMTKISGSSSRTTAVTIGSIIINNCIYKAKSSYTGSYALLNLDNSGSTRDKVDAVTFTNNTIEYVGAFLKLNTNSATQGSDSFALTVENNTFANMKACSTNGFFDIINGIKGTASVQNNLFVGTNANTGTRRVLREGNSSNFTNTFANNWYTVEWLTFTPDSSSGNMLNFLTDQSTLTNAALCPNYASSDFTVAASDVKTAAAGDPRWL